MSASKYHPDPAYTNSFRTASKVGILLVFGALAGLFALVTIFLNRAGLLDQVWKSVDWLLGANTVQVWWYVTRSAGFISYFLLWLSTAWGLALSSRLLDRNLQRGFTYEFHQFLSLLGIGFIGVHVLVLLIDHYLPFSLTQVLVPFTASYRPLWVGIGIISFYLILLVSVTFYIRQQIGLRAFRLIHLLSLVGYLGATLHGLYSGTDSPLAAVQLMYKGSALVIVFLLLYWLIYLRTIKPAEKAEKVGEPG